MPTALPASPATPAAPARRPIFDRPETILGVCESLGDDFGISGNWFRAALFPLLLWQPLATVAGYLTLALVVLAARLIFPDVRADAVIATEPVEALAPSPVADELRLAA
ncbi:PspC domain-containing protein [Sphingomonas sp.]|uniref:PspC domain-containing protein n=1 Tax=Sphingomonas sp. TaxID=28214 RepID=UPI00286C0F45|nr:PspC domain-containing protein [Sphingomonas sp.]